MALHDKNVGSRPIGEGILLPRVIPIYRRSELVYPDASLCHRNTSTKAFRPRMVHQKNLYLTPGGRHKDHPYSLHMPRVSSTLLTF
jgi:hypothetical protein